MKALTFYALIVCVAAASLLMLIGCAPTVSCAKIANPPFAERLAVGSELGKDGPVSQKWLEEYDGVLDACGFGSS